MGVIEPAWIPINYGKRVQKESLKKFRKVNKSKMDRHCKTFAATDGITNCNLKTKNIHACAETFTAKLF